MASSNPLLIDYVATPMSSIDEIHSRLGAAFASGKTRSLEFRKTQLRKLWHAVHDNQQRIMAAMKKDLNKPANETYMVECDWLEKDIMYAINNIDDWSKDTVPETPFAFKLMKPRVKKTPMGEVLIIGAFNYPLQLVLSPLVGAIVAGCTAVVKPSEMTPYSAALVKRIVEKALDPDCYAVVNGAIEETTKLLELKWDKIMYTGNSKVGRIISTAAAKHLTPCILELGGLNPVFITSTADAKLAAQRIAWGKVHNCGQICLAPDYIMIDPSAEAAFVESYISTVKKYLPNGPGDKDGYGHIVNTRHFDRIMNLLNTSAGKTVYGGQSNRDELWIEPTLIKIDSTDDALLSEEIFGPLLPYLVVEGGVSAMVNTFRKVGDTPLALYAFTTDKKEQDHILNSTRSGGVTFNDVMFHAAIQTIPFGGIGESGTGCYRGRASFDAFSHNRPVLNQPSWLEGQLKMRYPPYTSRQLATYKKANGVVVANFDREGRVFYDSFLWRLLFLGASGPKKALLRYIFLIFGAYFFKNFGLGMRR